MLTYSLNPWAEDSRDLVFLRQRLMQPWLALNFFDPPVSACQVRGDRCANIPWQAVTLGLLSALQLLTSG